MRNLIAQGVKVQMCVTSPPYFGLRDYELAAQVEVMRAALKNISEFPAQDFFRYPPADNHVLWGANDWLLSFGDVRRSVEALALPNTAADICARDGYQVTGVVLSRKDGSACIVNRSAVRWLSGTRDLWNLMFSNHDDNAAAIRNRGT